MVSIFRNPDRNTLGEHFLSSRLCDTVVKEAETGHLPVKGQGYRGRLVEKGGMECDRYVRDCTPHKRWNPRQRIYFYGMDIGYRPPICSLMPKGESIGEVPKAITLALPLLFDAPPLSNYHNAH